MVGHCLAGAARISSYSRQLFLFLLLAILLSACSVITRSSVDVADLEDPQLPGIEGARYWADVEPQDINDLIAFRENQRRAAGLTQENTTLALSGGGENGAFAAGILIAWSEAGTRPEFLTITGVSTGALAAPFAFLGSDYDDELRLLYGGLPSSQIIESRALLGILPNASVMNSNPLRRLIEKYVTDEFLRKVAKEHRRGRRLLVQTVSLDAQRPVIWDLGVIADSGVPKAKEYFRDVLLASAAIPGIFPPVLIEIETSSGRRDELHVDGGVISQSAFLPGWRIPNTVSGVSRLYAIRNGRVDPEPQITRPNLISVTQRSVATLIKSQGMDDLRIAYNLAKARGSTYQAAWIESDFTIRSEKPFEPEYMRALLSYGYDRFKSGNLWSDLPP